MSREGSTREWYRTYYGKRCANRNDLRTNRGVLFQALAMEGSVVQACYAIQHDPAQAKLLDVGCGSGADLFQLLRLGYAPENVVGIDILAERIAAARRLYPQIRFVQGDASCMDFPDGTFDLVFESTMFATLPDDALCAGIAREMIRVCRPGGYLLLVDWWMPRPGDPAYKALTRDRLRRLFFSGSDVELLKTQRGALVPPVGRFLSRFAPSMYFLVRRVCPFLVGQVAYLLRKSGHSTSLAASDHDQPTMLSEFTEDDVYAKAAV